MTEIRGNQSQRIVAGIGGIIFTLLGIFLFPKSIMQGFISILPILISLIFLIIGGLCLYFSWFYKIKIDAQKIIIGSGFFEKTFSKEEIKGYFLTKVYSKKEREGYINVLVLKLKNGDKKNFDAESLGENFKVLKKQFSKHYKLLPPTEKVNYQKERKRSKFKWGSFVGIPIFLLGLFLLITNYNSTGDLFEIAGTFKEKPTFQRGRNNKLTRINFKLNEYPKVTFSTVKNVSQLFEWGKQININDSIIIDIAKKSYDSKIAKTIPIEAFIVNYSPETIEIKRLKNVNGTYIYKENRFEDISLPIFIMLYGIGTFIFYWRKKTAIVIS